MTTDSGRNRRLLVGGIGMLLIVAVTFVAIGLIGGDSRWITAAVAPLLAGVGNAYEIVRRTHRMLVGAGWGAFAIAVGQGLVGFEATATLAGVVLVTIGMMPVAQLRDSRRLAGLAVWGAGLIGLSIWWLGRDGWAFGFGLAAGYIFMAWIQIELQRAFRVTVLGQKRSEMLIARASVSIIQLDFSAVDVELREMNTVQTDLEPFLIEHPEVMNRILKNVMIVDMNDAAAEEFIAIQVPSPVIQDEVLPTNIEAMAGWLTSMANRDNQWEGVIHTQTMTGGDRWYMARHIVTDKRVDSLSTSMTMANITELKLAQEALEKLDASKNEFIATVTHEMRTPLAGIVGFSAELLDHVGDYDSDMSREMIAMINRQSREIAYILDDLMIVAAAEMGSLKIAAEMVDVFALVNEVIGAIGIDVKIVGEQPATFAFGDPVRVRQILRNLLTNVDRYGGPDRRIEVEPDAERIRISVIDNGPGLDDERRAEIFDSYGAIESSGTSDSMGLGLNVSRTLADLMGARLRYQRHADETHFQLDLARTEVMGGQNDA